MNDILAALQQQTKVIEPAEQHDFMKDAVWENGLYRLGFDSRYYRDIDPCDREDFLSRLEKQAL